MNLPVHTLITHPRLHRQFETSLGAFPMAMQEWICDICNDELPPDMPVVVIEGYAMCFKCAHPYGGVLKPCECPGCAGGRAKNN